LETCDFRLDESQLLQKHVISILNRLESRARVVWLADGICNNGICQSSDGEIMIYRDFGHLSSEGSAVIGKRMNFYGLLEEDKTGVHRHEHMSISKINIQ
jgi:hypothetical protein